jgi:hypothetical protein
MVCCLTFLLESHDVTVANQRLDDRRQELLFSGAALQRHMLSQVSKKFLFQPRFDDSTTKDLK